MFAWSCTLRSSAAADEQSVPVDRTQLTKTTHKYTCIERLFSLVSIDASIVSIGLEVLIPPQSIALSLISREYAK